MSKNNRLSRKTVDVYDREFILSNGVHWHFRGSGLVFFETGSYGHFTNADWILRVLEFLDEHTGTSQVGIVVEPYKSSMTPDFLEEASVRDGILNAKFPSSKLADVCSFYDSEANYGLWVFSGINTSTTTVATSDRFPDVLMNADNIVFHLEIDLDGILMGFLRPQSLSDTVIDGLRDL